MVKSYDAELQVNEINPYQASTLSQTQQEGPEGPGSLT